MDMINLTEKNKTLEVEQVSFVLGDQYLISFQERPFGWQVTPFARKFAALVKCGVTGVDEQVGVVFDTA